jgi:hypothetical protein
MDFYIIYKFKFQGFSITQEVVTDKFNSNFFAVYVLL